MTFMLQAERWLSFELAVAVHAEQLATYGGRTGVRDPGLLSAAIARPRNLAQYGASDLAEFAAGYAYGIVRNHAFVANNAGTAAVLSEMFLAMNGAALNASDAELAVAFLDLADGELSEDELTDWFREHLA